MTDKIVPLREDVSPLARPVLQIGDPVRRRVYQPVLNGVGDNAEVTEGQSWLYAKFVGYHGDKLAIQYPDGAKEMLQSRAELLE